MDQETESMSRERRIAQTFVELTDTLVADFDAIDFLHYLTVRCRDIFAVTDAAVVLAYPGPGFSSAASCDPSPALRTVLDLALREGPAVDAHRSAAPVTSEQLTDAPAAWHDFSEQARRAGYTYASAVPLRLREDHLGSLLLLCTADSPLPAEDLALAQAFADAATIGLLHARTLQHTTTATEQLHTALHSRITIEQAKGFYAACHRISLDDAFNTMRHHARHHHLLLTAVARHIVNTGDLPHTPPASHSQP